ncbi:PREDICTED: uncharacterized protein LOC104823935 [Tarenaya hassleriana]|uniref:uncharacterized protein LOC104823935 n=1 Tax=Tarenaya hassleriana TaxID=28532 RepID=UPI00053C8582|nr:PREDICTED: uncharacterized protein LOC104823935 [Tarenaya hassleriana]
MTMERTALLFCFAILIASAALLDATSPSLSPAAKVPETVNDIEPYTTKVVKQFLADLEKECPKTQEFKLFFEKLRASAKYVCPITKAFGTEDRKAYESDMKASGISQVFMTFSTGEKGSGKSMKMIMKREELESMKIVNSLQSKFGKIVKKGDGSTKLTEEQQIAIKDAILRWEKSATRVVKILVRRSVSPRNPRDGQ